MEYNIQYKKSVYRDLKNVSKDEAKRIIEKLETSLRENPLSNPELKGEFKGLRKLRVGDYRVIYAVQKSDVLILRIRHRKEVYR